MFSRSLLRTLRLIPAVFVINSDIFRPYHAYFWNKKSPNDIDNRVTTFLEPSNQPCEDRNCSLQLTSIDGYAAAVFDGHGGWQMSEICSEQLLTYLDQEIKSCLFTSGKDLPQIIPMALKNAFKRVELEYESIARQGYIAGIEKIDPGFGRMSRVGSCALVAVVSGDNLYVANAGDSVAIKVKVANNVAQYLELNRELNANNPDEQARLKARFPNESDIIICKKENSKSCYVKGRLQPTYSLGDLRLKNPIFNNPKNYGSEMDFQTPLSVFTGPYINWEPEITVNKISKEDKCIVLASDGLWDELGRQQVAEIARMTDTSSLANALVDKALQKVAEAQNKSVQDIKAIPRGKKRKIHDDITVVVVDLKSQVL